MTETGLKPCPFCGSRAQIERGKIECSNPFCGASVEFSFPGKERNAWNNRTPAESVEAENKRLRRALEKYADPEHHFSVLDGKVWEVFDNGDGVDDQEFGTWAREALNGSADDSVKYETESYSCRACKSGMEAENARLRGSVAFAERMRIFDLLKSCCNEFAPRNTAAPYPVCYRNRLIIDADRHCTARDECPIYAELTKGARND